MNAVETQKAIEHPLTDKEVKFLDPKLREFRQIESIYQAKLSEMNTLLQLIAAQNGLEGNWMLDASGTKLIQKATNV